ncbi:41674_t:CDS:2 [Gigaspora margarita]|uniref:41674_t:CDS:1 n=1 Tax=Gigaspora margarita TaxID=4874 RepID=A0ABN7UPJ9_GIGMA|nr:41674_t:CDS:2 [Gigaspora margarita]
MEITVTIHNICAYPNTINLIKRLNIETNAIKKAKLIRQAALNKYSYLKRYRSISKAKTSIDETPTDIASSEKKNNTTSQVTVGISDIEHDEAYYVSIIVGNQKFRVILDTGSSTLWIPNNKCTDPDCKVHKRFNSRKSPTFKPEGKEWEIAYGTGSAAGITGKDNIQIGNLTAIKQIFGLANSVDDFFTKVVSDGIIGLAFDELNPMDNGAPTFISTLIKQKTIDPIFSFHFQHFNDSNDKGTFTLGGVDKSKFEGKITFTPVISSAENNGFWVINLEDVNVNDYSLKFSREAIIDTGTTLLIIPDGDAAAIHKKIPGSSFNEKQNLYIIPCNTTAVVSLKFGGVNYEIPSRYLTFDKLSKSQCISGIQTGLDFWLVGQTFIKNVYSAFDVGRKKVGFAHSK